LSLITITRVGGADYSGRQARRRRDARLINDPAKGYGIFIENMLEAAD
jgi:hypothetical protein